MGKSISGITNAANLKEWAGYAKDNSYGWNANAKHNLGTDGCDQDIVEGLPDLPRQKREEGRGYAPISKTTAKNTYTKNDCGTKRG